MVEIKTYKFNEGTTNLLKTKKYGTNWPIVYILNNEDEAYIGETLDASIRSNQHWANDVRKKLNKISIVGDDTFNKSSILDLESFLIKYMSADKTFKLQNGNSGLHNHNYYQKEIYERKFREIWNILRSKGLVKNDLRMIENSDLFKYSPYKALTVDQYMITNEILSTLASDVKNKKDTTFIVSGGAGTGKTILGVYLMKLLNDVKLDKIVIEEDQVEQDLNDIYTINDTIGELNIGLVIPMDNLRKTLKKVFKNIKGLNSKMVLSPNDVGKSENMFDLLIVDEAHRLRQRKNLTNFGAFDDINKRLGLNKTGTELDWILLKSKYQILFYDEGQSIKLTDVPKEKFDKLIFNYKNHLYHLNTQLRCLKGGNEYVDYIRTIFSNNSVERVIKFKEYDFKIFDNVNEMVNNIKSKDQEFGLCRTVAGFAWDWKTKKNSLNEINNNNLYDIEIDGYKYVWNTTAVDWINSPNSVNEIGCIHTTQGFDLNYCGLIIGNELKYNKELQKIYVDKSCYKDIKGKASTSDDKLLEYVLNIYQTMALRGMLGTYIYVCDNDLREYLKKYVNMYK